MTSEAKELTVVSGGGGELSVNELRKRVDTIHEVMRSVMKRGIHYDVIPGCKDPSLLKPGAELLAMTFRIAVEIQIVEEVVTDDEVSVRARAVARHASGAILGAAEGACSTREKKYRWRTPIHKKEFEAYPGDRKRITWNADGDEILQVRQEPGDLRNTIIQMASKRASVQVVRFICGASDIFVADPKDDRSEVDDSGGQRGRAADGDRGSAPADLYVKGFEATKKQNDRGPYTIYKARLSDGRQVTTFKDAIGKAAEAAHRGQYPVKVRVTAGNKPNELRLDSIERTDPKPTAAAPAAPATAPAPSGAGPAAPAPAPAADAKPEDLRRSVIEDFQSIGVSIADLKLFLGRDASTSSPEDVRMLRFVYDSIKAGETTWEESLAWKLEQENRSSAVAGDDQGGKKNAEAKS